MSIVTDERLSNLAKHGLPTIHVLTTRAGTIFRLELKSAERGTLTEQSPHMVEAITRMEEKVQVIKEAHMKAAK